MSMNKRWQTPSPPPDPRHCPTVSESSPQRSRRRTPPSLHRGLDATSSGEGRSPGRTAHLWFVVVLALKAVVVRALHERA